MFPGATADRKHADYVVVGAPLDVSTSFQPGTRFGPDRVRQFARTFEDYDHRTDQSFSTLGVHDAGDVRAWDDAEAYLDYLRGTLTDVVWDDAVPLLVGGEHTVSVAGVRAVDPDVFVALDAHLDLRDAYDGNPLSHSTVTRHALSVADEAYVVGARSGSGAEWERAREDDVTVVEPDEVRSWSPSFSGEVYVSVDVDAADPAFAPGTGTPEPGGLSSRTLRRLVRDLAPMASAFDVVEVNDRDDGQAAVLGAKLLRDFVFAHAAGE
ncbi:agmatinase [Salarchaeum sp. JOR-1]|uniref:agmatinase n=1 Tax=Salarchaeum sp. JOR-1 TaxID=2599399 RepID=UPI001198C27C|nr:agmatinase [Salarchaeum sp. JOR-1]QDX40640.1 agmatinase [Salarchaeum sp. JOR-1]